MQTRGTFQLFAHTLLSALDFIRVFLVVAYKPRSKATAPSRAVTANYSSGKAPSATQAGCGVFVTSKTAHQHEHTQVHIPIASEYTWELGSEGRGLAFYS